VTPMAGTMDTKTIAGKSSPCRKRDCVRNDAGTCRDGQRPVEDGTPSSFGVCVPANAPRQPRRDSGVGLDAVVGTLNRKNGDA